MKVAVIAAGSWGTALALVLHENNHQVVLWSKDRAQVDEMNAFRRNEKFLPGIMIPEKIEVTAELKKACDQAEVIVFAAPSQAYAGVLKQCVETGCIHDDTLIVNVAKGIDTENLMTPSQITEKIMPGARFVALSGPSHAEEVALKLPTALVSASKNRKDAERIQDLFSNESMRVYTNPDVMGVEISGALKNIIALAAGVSDGLGFGDNAKAALITRGIHEIAKLGLEMGGKAETFKGLAGVGDLIVTCTSMHSRNRRCGILIGKGIPMKEAIDQIGMVVEGIYSVNSAYQLMKKYNLDMPITEQLYEILNHEKNPREAVLYLMKRQKKNEVEAYSHESNDWWL